MVLARFIHLVCIYLFFFSFRGFKSFSPLFHWHLCLYLRFGSFFSYSWRGHVVILDKHPHHRRGLRRTSVLVILKVFLTPILPAESDLFSDCV